MAAGQAPKGNTIKHSKFLYTAALALAPQFCAAQQPAFASLPQPSHPTFTAKNDLGGAVAFSTSATETLDPEMADKAAPAAGYTSVAVKPAQPPVASEALFSRWLDVSEMSESQRYRNSFDQNGQKINAAGQQRTALTAHIKLDGEGRYLIGIRASSGQFFNWGYANYIGHDFKYYSGLTLDGFTPTETANFFSAYAADPAGADQNFANKGWNFYVRDLYVSATPIKQLTVEFGSIQIERGYSSEITTFDEDGFIAGERVRVHDKKHLWADEVSFTNAYLGDVVTPSFFKRGNRLKDSNYRQVAAKKQINGRVGVSAEYNWLTGTNTLREAAAFKIPESRVADEVRVELYQRVNTLTFPGIAASFMGPIAPLPIKGAAGFAVTLEKKVGAVSGNVGYATVDSNYGVYTNSRFLNDVGFSLNGDSYSTGNRAFVHLNYKVTPVITAFGFFTHTVSGTDYTYSRQGFNAGLKFDLKAIINSGKKIL